MFNYQIMKCGASVKKVEKYTYFNIFGFENSCPWVTEWRPYLILAMTGNGLVTDYIHLSDICQHNTCIAQSNLCIFSQRGHRYRRA